MKNKILIISVIILLLNIPITTTTSQNNPIKVLIIHSTNKEFTNINQILVSSNYSLEINSSSILEMNNLNIEKYDMLFFLSSVDFDENSNFETQLKNFVNNPQKAVVVFTPYISNFNDDLELALGIGDTSDTFPDIGYANWQLELNQSLDTQQSQTYNYTGKFTEFTPTVGAKTIVSVTSGILPANSTDDLDDINFPRPAIINATNNKANIITSTLNSISETFNQALHLSQLSDIFSSLIQSIISVTINSYSKRIENLTNPITNVTSITSSNTSTNQTNSANQTVSSALPKDNALPSLPSFNLFDMSQLIIAGIILIFLMIFSKITGFLNWISKKFIGIGIAVVGIFYNVEDRILDPKDVYLNRSRAEIMDFLDAVGRFGSHIREIKSITNLGSGALLWHLKVLEDFNFIRKYKIDKYTVYISVDYEESFDSTIKQIELGLHSKYTFDVLTAVNSFPTYHAITIHDLQEITNVNAKTLRRIIKKMDKFGILEIINEKPIQFQLSNTSKFDVLLDSMRRRKDYALITSDIQVNKHIS